VSSGPVQACNGMTLCIGGLCEHCVIKALNVNIETLFCQFCGNIYIHVQSLGYDSMFANRLFHNI